MQFKALIFTLCTLFYWVEYTAVPRMMNPSPATPQAAHSCCHEAPHPEKQCPKPSKGCNPTSDCCLNCPLCYTAILTVPPQHAEANQPAREYNRYTSSYVYLHHSSCWKPPDAA